VIALKFSLPLFMFVSDVIKLFFVDAISLLVYNLDEEMKRWHKLKNL
jgi:hypothetical protein